MTVNSTTVKTKDDHKRLSGLDVLTLLLVVISAVYLGVEAIGPSAISSSMFLFVDWVLLIVLCIEFVWRTSKEGIPIPQRMWKYIVGDRVRSKSRLRFSHSAVHTVFYYADLIIIAVYATSLIRILQVDLHELSLLRIMRLLIFVRVLDSDPLRDFVTTVLHSVKSVSYALVVVCVHFYVYAVCGTFLFRSAMPYDFGDLGSSCVTLMHVNTGAGFTHVLEKIRDIHPGLWTLGFAYFSSYIFVGVVLLVGIVTAMITNDVWDHRNKAN
jgi:hypothetical protein